MCTEVCVPYGVSRPWLMRWSIKSINEMSMQYHSKRLSNLNQHSSFSWISTIFWYHYTLVWSCYDHAWIALIFAQWHYIGLGWPLGYSGLFWYLMGNGGGGDILLIFEKLNYAYIHYDCRGITCIFLFTRVVHWDINRISLLFNRVGQWNTNLTLLRG